MSAHTHLAALLRYPRADYPAMVEECRAALALEHREAAALIERFGEIVAGLTPTEREELFTATFDLNPVCALEIGWHLFGEEYDRGQMMVKMRELLARFELPESTELPDHLTHVLAILGAMGQPEAAAFAGACVIPVLAPMIAALADAGNPYADVVRAVEWYIGTRHAQVNGHVLALEGATHG